MPPFAWIPFAEFSWTAGWFSLLMHQIPYWPSMPGILIDFLAPGLLFHEHQPFHSISIGALATLLLVGLTWLSSGGRRRLAAASILALMVSGFPAFKFYLIIRSFSVSFMSDAKWRKVFGALADADLTLERATWKFIDSGHLHDWGAPGRADLFSTRLANGRFQPEEYRWIEWIHFPRAWRPIANVDHPVAQDIEGLRGILEATGQFHFVEEERGLTLFGYGREPTPPRLPGPPRRVGRSVGRAASAARVRRPGSARIPDKKPAGSAETGDSRCLPTRENQDDDPQPARSRSIRGRRLLDRRPRGPGFDPRWHPRRRGGRIRVGPSRGAIDRAMSRSPRGRPPRDRPWTSKRAGDQ